MKKSVTTVTFNEEEIMEVFKQYLVEKGYKLEGFQAYKEDREIFADVRVEGNLLL